MSSPNRMQFRLIDWLRPQLKWVTVPSWFLSAIFHLLLAVLLLYVAQLPSCRKDFGGDEGESFREVGIHERPAQVIDSDADESDDQAPHDSPADRQMNPLAAPEVAEATESPVPLSLPSVETPTPVIGAGQLPSPDAGNPNDLVQPLAPAQVAGGNRPPVAGGTSFLGIEDTGKRFVYVIDHSFSMETGQALQAAKAELLASLAQLDETQEFQIVFYNHEPTVLQTRRGKYFSGTDPQRLQVMEQIRVIRPSGGTRHFPALMEALRLEPEVIFLLTDGDAHSALSRKETEDLKRRNRNNARIHCIEFGMGRQRDAGNFLKKLASEHGGQYTYRDIRSFSRSN
jgi:hypothetical protein